MSNISNELGCRNIGLILKDYSFIADHLSRHIGANGGAERDIWGASLGEIANPYYAEMEHGSWANNIYKSSTYSYIDYIKKVFDDSPSFEKQYSLSDVELGTDNGTTSTYKFGNSLSSILNGIQSFVTDDKNNSAGSAWSKLYSLHNDTDNTIGVIDNYNINEPYSNLQGKSDTLMANLGIVYRGKSIEDGFIQWGDEGPYGNYSPISSRMALYFFTEEHYGYGLNQNFGNSNMSSVGMTHIEDIYGPVDDNFINGIVLPDANEQYAAYYKDLGWRSKYYHYNSMLFNYENSEVGPYIQNIQPTDAYFPEELPAQIQFYPLRTVDSAHGGISTYGINANVIYNRISKTYESGYTRFEFSTANDITDYHENRYQYAEKDGNDVDKEVYDFEHRVDEINNYDDEDENVHVGSNGEIQHESVDLTPLNGQEHGHFRAIDHRSAALPYRDIVAITNEAFIQGTYESLVARFHTSTDDGRTPQDTQTALSKTFGLSHGRNLLKAGVYNKQDGIYDTYSNGYSNPYCRVWTYHHQYHTFYNLLRSGTWNKTFDAALEEDASSYPFRAAASSDREGFMPGQRSLDTYSVLNHTTNLVNITPKGDDPKFDTKRTMLSIENLAWRDNIILPTEDNNYFTNLKSNQIGPLGGRIMWFPPYNLSFSESEQNPWESVGQFIGRSEQMYAFKGGERKANLSFTILVDHPSILDYIDREKQKMYDDAPAIAEMDGVDDTGSTEQSILRFFAGCDVLSPKMVTPTEKPIKKTTHKETIEEPKKRKVRFAVFFPNNYSGWDLSAKSSNYGTSGLGPKDALCYLANGIGTQLYLDIDQTNVDNRDLKYVAASWLPVDLKSQFQPVTDDEEVSYGQMLYDFRKENKTYYIQNTLTKVSCNKTRCYKDYASDTTRRYPSDQQTAHGYEMAAVDRDDYQEVTPSTDEAINYCGISRVPTENWRFFYPLKDGGDATLSANVSPVFLMVRNNSDSDREHIYYMPTIDGGYEKTDIGDHNYWLYQVDYSSYTYPKSKNRKDRTGHHYEEVLTCHADYCDDTNYNLNCIEGLSNVSTLMFAEEFSPAEGYNTYGSGDTEYCQSWVSDDDTQLISFADFMVACYMIENDTEDLSDINLREGKDYCMDNVNLMYEILTSGHGTISCSGFSNYHGVENKTSNSADDQDANKKLAEHRMQVVLDYLDTLKGHKMANYDVEAKCYKNMPYSKSDTGSKWTKHSLSDDGVDVSQISAKLWRSACFEFNWSSEDEDGNTSFLSEDTTEYYSSDGTLLYKSIDTARGKNRESAEHTENIMYSKESGDATYQAELEEQIQSAEEELKNNQHRYEDEYEFFKTVDSESPFLKAKIREKIQNFDPAFHSISPEGFNARLTFLHQCMHQGPTYDATNSNNASNLAFGRPPVLVLRIGDFIYSKCIVESMSFKYDNDKTPWDLNPEGIGVQPMTCTVDMGLTLFGGQDLGGPIPRLQNATSFNYYANTRVYDDRAEQIEYDENQKSPYEFNLVPNPNQ